MAHMIKAHYELLQRQFQWKSEWCRKMNWVINHLSLINSTLLLTLLGVPSCGSYDKLVEAASPLPTTRRHSGQPDGRENFTHQFHLLWNSMHVRKFGQIENVLNEIQRCALSWTDWRPEQELPGKFASFQRLLPPPFLSSFPLYSEKCTTRERESSNCLLLRASEPLFPSPFRYNVMWQVERVLGFTQPYYPNINYSLWWMT